MSEEEQKMPRLHPVDFDAVPAATQQLLADVEDQLGMVPNLIATMAQSTSAVGAYWDLASRLTSGVIEAPLREQIALAVSQANRCDYCIAAHLAVGASVGLTEDEGTDARDGTSPDRKTEAVLRFAKRIVEKRGAVADDDIREIRNAGFGEPEIVEVIGHIVLNIFANYVNLVAQTEIDFPPVTGIGH